MNAHLRLIWGVLTQPRVFAKGVVERPPLGLCLGMMVGVALLDFFLTPVDDRGGYPFWLWAAWIAGFTLVLSFGTTFLTWVWCRMDRAPAPYLALFCIGELSVLPSVPMIPLYPLMKGSWAGYHAWHLLSLLPMAWSAYIFLAGVAACSQSRMGKALRAALPTLAIGWCFFAWGWWGQPSLEGAYPWAQVASPTVQIYFPGFVHRPAVQAMVPESGKLVGEVSRLLEVEPPDFQVSLFLFPDDATHRKAVPNDWPDGTAIAHDRSVSMIYGPWRRLRPVVAHELGHVISIYRIAPDLSTQPLLCEGLAEFIAHTLTPYDPETAEETELKITTGTDLRTLGRADVFYDGKAMGGMGHNYPHAGSFVRYLIVEHGMERFKQLCREASAGGLLADPVEELEKTMVSVYGRGLAEMEASWRQAEEAE